MVDDEELALVVGQVVLPAGELAQDPRRAGDQRVERLGEQPPLELVGPQVLGQRLGDLRLPLVLGDLLGQPGRLLPPFQHPLPRGGGALDRERGGLPVARRVAVLAAAGGARRRRAARRAG